MQGINKRGLEPGWPSQGLRVKRAILAGRRAGPSTPVPSWKVFNNQLYDGIAAAAAAHAAAGRPTPVSARKLAASLWELQDLPLPACLCSQHWPSSLKGISDMSSPRSQPDLAYPSPRSCKYSNQQFAQMGSENGRRSVHINRQSAAMRSHVHRLLDTRDDPGGVAGASILLEGERQQHSPLLIRDKKGEGRSREEKPVTTSSELLKVLSRIRILEEQHNSSMKLASTLQGEVGQARARVQELELAQKAARKEVESVVKRMAEEKSSWKAKEQEKIKAAVEAVKEEVEEERKARRRIEMTNRKMTKELVEANMAAAKALQELERERKARELMEDVCDELAREIGDDKAEVEELKRESEKVREELEEERRMLQLAEVWREERVQMKLGEAKVALEEKSAALDVLRAELETFLGAEKHGDPVAAIEEAEVLRNVITAIHPKGIVASFPPVELNQAASPDSDLYTVDMGQDEQVNGHDGQHWGTTSEFQTGGSSWAVERGEMVEDNAAGRPYALVAGPDTALRRNPSDSDGEEGKEGDSGSDYVSESHGSEADDRHDDVEGEGSEWDGHEDEIHHQNGGSVHESVHEEDPEDNDQYLHDVEDIVALNGREPDIGIWREEVHDDGCTTTSRDKDHAIGNHLNNMFNGHLQGVSQLSPQQRTWSSPESGNPHVTRGIKGHVEWPKNHVDVALRAKLYEANLEQHQTRFR